MTEGADKDAPPTPAPHLDAGAARATRTMLVAGPVLAALGIAWTAAAPSTASSAAVIVGLLTCIYGTHRFGRQGVESPDELTLPREASEDPPE